MSATGAPSRMRFAARHARLGRIGEALALAALGPVYRAKGLHGAESAFARRAAERLRARLDDGETLHLAGVGVAGHNSGAALVRVSARDGVDLLANHEEERFTGEKHTAAFPVQALGALRRSLDEHGLQIGDIAAWLATWDYAALGASLLRAVLEELPGSLGMVRPAGFAPLNVSHLFKAARAPARLAEQFGAAARIPLIAVPHHECHAWFSFCASPFARDDAPAIVSVIDGTGDRGAISVFLARGSELTPLFHNDSVFDSLGLTYSFISSTQGGWTILSSEGRYMGAAAYGDTNRLTNPFYRMIRGLFSLEPGGRVRLNRSLARWPSRLMADPYAPALAQMLGPPIPPERLWNPDAVLRVDGADRDPDVGARVDKAAALQMVFEDALFHVVDAAIDRTGCDRLVLAGGTALNALANMRLLECFGEDHFIRRHGRRSRLQLWAPPIPGDAGVPPGAAFAFARHCGAKPGAPMTHAFRCGFAPTEHEIRAAVRTGADVAWLELGEAATAAGQRRIADLMAFVTARDGVMAVIRGKAETGPRALGHRSILANACSPHTRETLNARVKYREPLRPLAPVMTSEAAERWFVLEPGAAADDHDAYTYMVVTARARPGTAERLPAVVHVDGTARLQIVRPAIDPLLHAYLRSLGTRLGCEVAVNTSFNVAAPIVQTAGQAVETLHRAGGLDVLLLFAEEGPVIAAWSTRAERPSRFAPWLQAWRETLAATANP